MAKVIEKPYSLYEKILNLLILILLPLVVFVLYLIITGDQIGFLSTYSNLLLKIGIGFMTTITSVHFTFKAYQKYEYKIPSDDFCILVFKNIVIICITWIVLF